MDWRKRSVAGSSPLWIRASVARVHNRQRSESRASSTSAFLRIWLASAPQPSNDPEKGNGQTRETDSLDHMMVGQSIEYKRPMRPREAVHHQEHSVSCGQPNVETACEPILRVVPKRE